jgi:hypothetical protein
VSGKIRRVELRNAERARRSGAPPAVAPEHVEYEADDAKKPKV